jgi:hypothetical protein
MFRKVLAVIAGYVAMFLVVFLGLTAAFLAMGSDRAFQAQSYEVTPVWLVVMFIVSALAALVGGWVAANISPHRKTVLALAGVVVVLGILSAIPALTATAAPAAREGDVPNLEAMMNARQPAWVALALPVVGAVGAWLGGQRRLSRGSAEFARG